MARQRLTIVEHFEFRIPTSVESCTYIIINLQYQEYYTELFYVVLLQCIVVK